MKKKLLTFSPLQNGDHVGYGKNTISDDKRSNNQPPTHTNGSSMVHALAQGTHDAQLGVSDPERAGRRFECRDRIQELDEAEDRFLSDRSEREEQRRGVQRFVSDFADLFTKGKIFIGFLVLIVCPMMMVLNSGRFAVNETQSWFAAVLFTSVLPLAAFGFEAIASKLAARRQTLDRTMATLLVLSLAVFLGSFAQDFTYLPGIGTIDDLMGGFDYRAIFISQTVLEFTTVYAVLQKLKAWLRYLEEPVYNPIWLCLTGEIEQIDAKLAEVRAEKRSAMSELATEEEREKQAQEAREKFERFLRS